MTGQKLDKWTAMNNETLSRGEKIQRFILEAIGSIDVNFSASVSKEFGITRQAVNRHVQRLIEMGWVKADGATRNRKYVLCELVKKEFYYSIVPSLAEDEIWAKDVRPAIEPLPDNVRELWNYAVTEMLNNVIDHSEGRNIVVSISKNAVNTEIQILDDGVGIFRKIRNEMNLMDDRLSIFELAKGKLTTDPEKHTGEGIFFTSRMMDRFSILSGGLYFDHDRHKDNDWLIDSSSGSGTSVFMTLANNSTRASKDVFDEFSTGDEYAFNKTIVPLDLAKFGVDELVSRSQAKRVLNRVNLFSTVIFDFKGVAEIGQSFADEIFRVYANEHPNIHLIPINMEKRVKQMIDRATATVV
jgi:biotin operon repressor